MEIKKQQLSYHYFEGSDKNAPILVIYHGWAGSAAGYYDIAEELQEQGYTVVLPEIVHHDSRGIAEDYFDVQTRHMLFWDTVLQTIEEFNILIADLNAQMKDVVVIGSSMGGFIANGIFAKYDVLKGLVNVNGSGAFLLLDEIFRRTEGRSPIDEAGKAKLQKYDPILQPYHKAPVLLLHGEKDSIVDIAGQQAYFRHCHSAAVTFKTYPDVDHQFTPLMVEDIKNWLDIEIRRY